MCTSTEAGPHNVSEQTFQRQMQLAGLWNECLFCSVLYYHSSAETYGFCKPTAPFQRGSKSHGKGQLSRDSMTSYWLMFCKEILFSDMSGGSGSMPHTVRRGDKGLDLASWTFYRICFDCCPEAGGSTLNLGGFSCCCQTEEEMRGYFSLSYVFACYLYCYEKFFR